MSYSSHIILFFRCFCCFSVTVFVLFFSIWILNICRCHTVINRCRRCQINITQTRVIATSTITSWHQLDSLFKDMFCCDFWQQRFVSNGLNSSCSHSRRTADGAKYIRNKGTREGDWVKPQTLIRKLVYCICTIAFVKRHPCWAFHKIVALLPFVETMLD